MPDRATDERFLRQALELARRGIGLTSPNPCVGALLLSTEKLVVGTGTHLYERKQHAEILALEQAGVQARGATLYVNLEPCCHQGRTGACTDALIAAGIRRVVACMPDPNPQVSGQGFERLREAGIAVTTNLLEDDARRLNEAFGKYIRHHLPMVTLKAAMTLDGKIAPPPADPQNASSPGAGGNTGGWITSQVARNLDYSLRHQNDAILVGVGTIVADDPLLTDRSEMPRRRPLLRVILDSHLRLPLASRVVQSAQDDVLVLCSLAEENRKRELLAHGIRVEQVPYATPDGRPDMNGVVRRLGELEICSVITEGGAMMNWAALASGAVDKLFLYYAPKILAGTGSVPFASGAGFQRIADAAQLKSIRLHRFGEDFAVEGYLKDPYRD